ncbi:hypothetical protein ACJQWK_04779 [Exserohilum turcicum]
MAHAKGPFGLTLEAALPTSSRQISITAVCITTGRGNSSSVVALGRRAEPDGTAQGRRRMQYCQLDSPCMCVYGLGGMLCSPGRVGAASWGAIAAAKLSFSPSPRASHPPMAAAALSRLVEAPAQHQHEHQHQPPPPPPLSPFM